MFLSKIWFVLVGLLAGIAVTAAFVAPRPADRRIEQLEGQRMDRAQYAAEQMLKNDARRWIDYVSKLGTDGKLIDALDSATRGSGELRPLHEAVRNRLRELVPDRQGIGVESIIAVDAKGRVVARVGDDEGEFGESIAGAEVVTDALRGYLSDDVWGASNRLRRIGAAPVLSKSHDRIVGALVVAVETGKRLAEMWKQNLGVEVAIVLRKDVLSSTLPEALLNQLPEVIDEHSAEIASHKRTRALPVYMGNERLLMVAAPFIGEASEQRAYYVLLTKKSPESDPWALLSSTSSDDLKWGRFPWLPLGFGIIGVIAVGLILQRREVESPLKHLRAEVHRLAKQEILKLDDTRYGGKLGGIARDINATVEHFTHAPIPKSETAKKDIASILDPGKAASADGKTFDVAAPAPAKPAVPPPAAMAASLFGTPKSAPGAAQPPALPQAAPPAPFLAPSEPAPFVVPPSLHSAPPVAHQPPPRPPLPSSHVAKPEPVHQTEPSAEILRSAEIMRPTEAESDEDPDQAHFNQVFEEYLALRQKCGESIVGLSVEKFTAKLRSNREQLVAKYNCKTAHFTVYEKDGKAAIRAVPVRA
jgi:Double sensory domain of two-component sensor kinase